VRQILDEVATPRRNTKTRPFSIQGLPFHSYLISEIFKVFPKAGLPVLH